MFSLARFGTLSVNSSALEVTVGIYINTMDRVTAPSVLAPRSIAIR